MDADQPPPDVRPASKSASVPRRRGAPRWLVLAIGSGAFAAMNGVFAKLTTSESTGSFSAGIAHIFGLDSGIFINFIVRGICFGLNLLSNAIMWMLFTAALTAATSTTRVAILNTSANFMVTAVMGLFIFGEQLPLGWWGGAALLVAGSVVIGAREGKAQEHDAADGHIALGDNDEQRGEAVAVALGAGGVGENTLAEGRFRDSIADDDDDEGEDHDHAGNGVDDMPERAER